MASTYYGITTPGGRAGDVVESATTTGLNVELVVLNGVSGVNKLEVAKALDELKDYIISGDELA